MTSLGAKTGQKQAGRKLLEQRRLTWCVGPRARWEDGDRCVYEKRLVPLYPSSRYRIAELERKLSGLSGALLRKKSQCGALSRQSRAKLSCVLTVEKNTVAHPVDPDPVP